MRCRDCGETFTENHSSKLHDVCNPCWYNRIWVTSGIVPIGPEFVEVQRAMETRSGRAKQLIEALREEYE